VAKVIIPCIYKLTFTNGKCYIGQTRYAANRRFNSHRRYAAWKTSKIYNAWRKYGEPRLEIILHCSKEWLNHFEEHFINEYEAFTNGYNSTTGGDSPLEISAETRRKLSESSTGRQYTESSRKKMSESRKGIVFSAETLEKMRNARKGKPGTKHTEANKKLMSECRMGRRLTEETKRKLSVVNTGKKLPKETLDKMSLALRGLKRTVETRKRMAESKKGHIVTQETRDKIRATMALKKVQCSKNSIKYK